MPKAAKPDARQKRFIKEYIIDRNATRAARAAGFSAKTSRQIGSELLSRPYIRDAIEDEELKRATRTELTADRVQRELMMIAFLDQSCLFDEDGNLLPVNEMPFEARHALAGFEQITHEGLSTTSKVKVIDKKGALELLGRQLKMFGADTHIDLSNLSIKVEYE